MNLKEGDILVPNKNYKKKLESLGQTPVNHKQKIISINRFEIRLKDIRDDKGIDHTLSKSLIGKYYKKKPIDNNIRRVNE